MSIKITIPNSSSDVLTFGSGNTPTAAQIAGIDSGSSNGQLAFYTTASGTSIERGRFTSTGELTYTKSTLAQYNWTGFNPTNLTGTTTNAPSTGTTYDTNYVTMVNSSGTLTITFDIAGSYLVIVSVETKHAQSYTYEYSNFSLGGTATRTSPSNSIPFYGVDSNDADTSGSVSFLVTATAGQTITVLAQYGLTGNGTTAQHTCYPFTSVLYCGG